MSLNSEIKLKPKTLSSLMPLAVVALICLLAVIAIMRANEIQAQAIQLLSTYPMR